MADNLELHEGEVVESEVKGDYWEKTLCMYSQKSGKYWFTNQRILFRGGFTAALRGDRRREDLQRGPLYPVHAHRRQGDDEERQKLQAVGSGPQENCGIYSVKAVIIGKCPAIDEKW